MGCVVEADGIHAVTCARIGCQRAIRARGLCHNHYNTARRRGDFVPRFKAATISLDVAFATFVDGLHERGPQVRDFQEALGLSSTSTVQTAYKRMRDAGLIEYVERGAGGYYRLSEAGRALRESLTQDIRRAS